MEASTGPSHTPTPITDHKVERIKQKLLQKGVYPTPKIIHTLRKKELQKSLRKSKRRLASQSPPFTDSQKQFIADEVHFQALKAEYKDFSRAIAEQTKGGRGGAWIVGKPWESLEKMRLRELSSESREYGGDKLKSEHLRELSNILEKDRNEFRWLLDDDIELEEGWLEKENQNWAPPKQWRSEVEAIRFLVDKLSATNLSMKDWRFSRMMKQSGLQFTEDQLLKIVEGLGDKGQWKHAMFVVEWTYSSKERKRHKSRFVYTKLLAILGKTRRPKEALQIFNLMREDCHIYPDMAAYHSIAVTLGQAGLLRELLNIIECMRQKPIKKLKNMRRKNWDPILHPDLVVFNSVLNACIPSCQWKGVSWVFNQLRKSGIEPNGATYGLAMEVMLQSGKYDLVHKFFGKMRRSGEAPKALTYKVLVRAFWKEGKVDEAIQAVRDMERRGVVGTASVYYELACCLCNNGRWQEAMMEVEKLKKLPHSRPLEVTFTGMIKSSLYGGHLHDCISIFQKIRNNGRLDIGIINIMLKVFGQNDMFSSAKELFEETKRGQSDSSSSLNGTVSSLNPDVYTYSIMLEASAKAHQWEYFEYVYREMVLAGYQVDQSKHDSMLLEASRAGKWYLLEHAFDIILEAGEVPHPSFFTELMCQAIIQHDYGRVVVMLNAMAYAPFQVSEELWIDLLEKNGDRLCRDDLKELLKALHNHALPTETTVSNFLRSLSSLCERDRGNEISAQATDGIASRDEQSLDCDEHVNNRPVLLANNNQIVPCKDLQSDGNTVGLVPDDDRSDAEDDADLQMLAIRSHCCDSDVLVDEAAYGYRFSDYDVGGDSDIEKAELDRQTSKELNSNESNVPSASEILELWKDSRKKNGIFLPSWFGD